MKKQGNKLRVRRDEIKSLRVRSDVRTGFGTTLYGCVTDSNIGCTLTHTCPPTTYN
jgi:hypothetical protein